MSQGGEWLYPDRSHRQLLQSFTCTVPKEWRLRSRRREKYHPRPWEYEVQSYVRDLRPPLPHNRRALISLAGGEMAAVTVVRIVEPWFYYIEVVAVSLAFQGSGLGGQALRAAIEEAALWGAEHSQPEITVEGFVHRDNRGSLRMCGSLGMGRVIEDDTDELLCHQATVLTPNIERD